ncbi:MurR/RpiR family transcriptional regulator [Vagococcus intermedius]|uniref:MurR/RpiR family transcriptional regulator n=1 Tax=Vagococcus intermedius TaxID=2991418 RepID=A0AAF0CVA3_9ENTE|nr:MurR/RpiR family transcriptional regulator [Vagococcus intermedius]WEG73519.1 MurR/RpiR family transcriptional regulator [Vagococcus intermedius]WEG75601.1 MurR/RpiR family transcriptional regulator [Vagococcus intermedius]
MPNNILFTIQEKMETFSKSEKKLASWILANSSEVIHMTTKSLSEATNVSPATIVRFCYSLNLNGFTDLKLNISTHLPQIKEDLYSDIIKNENISQIKKKLNFKVGHAFDETIDKLNDDMIEEAIAALEAVDMVYTYGIGASGLVAEDIYQKLTRIGKNVFFTKDDHLLATALVSNPTKSLLFAISNSGQKKEVIALAKIAKEQNIPVIILTNAEQSPLALLADILLLTASSGEAPLRSSATSSLLVQLFTIDILYSAYASRHYETVMARLNQSKNAITKLDT